MTEPTKPDWTRGVKVTVAAQHYGVSVDTIRRWADAGLIESYRTPSGQRRIVLGSETTPATGGAA
jgi:predicted site-specific integrase-resolvase